MLSRDCSLGTKQLKQLNVKLQQLDRKLKLLNKEILDKCNVDAIEQEINESEAVSAKILECKQQIAATSTATVSRVPTAPIVSDTNNKLKLSKLMLP